MNSLSHNSDVYVDDSYLQRETYQACHYNFSDHWLIGGTGLCFIQTKKSVLTPNQTIVFLWLYYFIKNMILSLTYEKNSTKQIWGKLNHLLKQKLRYNGELITLTVHVTILAYLILILLYILMKLLKMGYHWWYIPIQGNLA